MNWKTFDEFQAVLLAEVVKMKDTKGKEYANSEDRFANFRRLSNQLGIEDYQVAWVYATKHLDAIASYMRIGQTLSEEGIYGRLVDAITYLTLIAGMIEELKPVHITLNASTIEEPTLPDYNTGKHQPMEYDPTPGDSGNA